MFLRCLFFLSPNEKVVQDHFDIKCLQPLRKNLDYIALERKRGYFHTRIESIGLSLITYLFTLYSLLPLLAPFSCQNVKYQVTQDFAVWPHYTHTANLCCMLVKYMQIKYSSIAWTINFYIYRIAICEKMEIFWFS